MKQLFGTHRRIGMAIKFAMKVSTAFLLVLLLVMELASPALASPADVNIYHAIPGPDAIRVDCLKGSHHIFTPQTLVFGQHFGWGFTPNIWGLTKYYCDITWKTYTRRVRVWVDSNPLSSETSDPRPCTHCLWRVTTEGFYRMTSDRGEPPAFEGGWVGPP